MYTPSYRKPGTPQKPPRESPRRPSGGRSKVPIVIAIVVVLAIVVLAFIMLFDQPSSTSSDDVVVEISYEGPWSANIATQLDGKQNEITVSGPGTKTYKYRMSEGDIVSIIAQKLDEGTGDLMVIIRDGGKEVKNVHTTDPKGIVATLYEIEASITSTGDIEVKIMYEGSWTAGIATQISGEQDAISVNGTGTETYTYTLSKGDIITVVAQKEDDVTGELRVIITDGGREVRNVYSSESIDMVATKYELK